MGSTTHFGAEAKVLNGQKTAARNPSKWVQQADKSVYGTGLHRVPSELTSFCCVVDGLKGRKSRATECATYTRLWQGSISRDLCKFKCQKDKWNHWH